MKTSTDNRVMCSRCARTRTGNWTGRARQRGQSLVEVAILLIVLVPLAAGIWLLGQYTHVREQTLVASREAAWDATVSPQLAVGHLPAQATEQRVLRRRRFADAGRVIRSSGAAPPEFADPLLSTFADRQLLAPDDFTLSVYKQTAAPSYLDKGIRKIGTGLTHVGLRNSLPPNSKGLVTAVVHAHTRPVRGRGGRALAFLGTLTHHGLDMSAKTVLLADAWDASGGGESPRGEDAKTLVPARSVRSVIKPMVPLSWVLSKVQPFLDFVTPILTRIPGLGIITAGMDGLEFGRMAPDVAPADKLVK